MASPRDRCDRAMRYWDRFESREDAPPFSTASCDDRISQTDLNRGRCFGSSDHMRSNSTSSCLEHFISIVFPSFGRLPFMTTKSKCLSKSIASKADFPDRTSQAKMANEYTSAESPYSLHCTTSGAMYRRLPVSPVALNSSGGFLKSARFNSFANPKSNNRISPRKSNATLSGLRSRNTIMLLCKYLMARATSKIDNSLSDMISSRTAFDCADFLFWLRNTRCIKPDNLLRFFIWPSSSRFQCSNLSASVIWRQSMIMPKLGVPGCPTMPRIRTMFGCDMVDKYFASHARSMLASSSVSSVLLPALDFNSGRSCLIAYRGFPNRKQCLDMYPLRNSVSSPPPPRSSKSSWSSSSSLSSENNALFSSIASWLDIVDDSQHRSSAGCSAGAAC
mmetsp:Transcript_11701/g.33734  ORF Transcript_11701/g.33734 Transcript_11701/m.33734 type:complete len:391 (-) Transcript_11701:1004-2176(-)